MSGTCFGCGDRNMLILLQDGSLLVRSKVYGAWNYERTCSYYCHVYSIATASRGLATPPDTFSGIELKKNDTTSYVSGTHPLVFRGRTAHQ